MDTLDSKVDAPQSSHPGSGKGEASAAKKSERAKNLKEPGSPHSLHDWFAIKTAYVEGTIIDGVRTQPTLEELSQKFNCPLSSMRKRSMSERWKDQRNLFMQKVERARQEKTSEVLASKGAEFDSKALEVAEKIILKAETLLGVQGLKASDVKLIAGSVKDAHHVGRLALGESTSNEDVRAKVSHDLTKLADDELDALETLLTKSQAPGDAAGKTVH